MTGGFCHYSASFNPCAHGLFWAAHLTPILFRRVISPRPPLRPPARSLVPQVPTSPPISHMSSSTSFLSDNLVDTLPTPNIIIDGAFLDEIRATSFFPMPRTPSPDKPLPIVPLFPPSLSSIDGSTRYSDSTLDSTLDSISLRNRIDTLPSTPTIPAKDISTGLSKRTHTLLQLIESERAYASDLALIRDVHLSVALGTCIIFLFPSLYIFFLSHTPLLGNEPPIATPPESSSSSLRTLSNASGSSVTLFEPPMSRDDARIIFRNVTELAEFAHDFVTRLEIALGNALPSGKGEDRVGALFIEMVR